MGAYPRKTGVGRELVLSEKGSIQGSVRTWDAVINGTITGDLEIGHFLELQANARVTGNITYRQMQLDCGAAVEGRLVCAGEAAAEAGGPAAAPKPARDAKVVDIPAP